MNYCRKRIYGTDAHATTAIASLHARDRYRESPERLAKLRAYYCEDCRGWHVGHVTPRDEERYANRP